MKTKSTIFISSKPGTPRRKATKYLVDYRVARAMRAAKDPVFMLKFQPRWRSLVKRSMAAAHGLKAFGV